MDLQLEQRWKSASSPFDGDCARLDDCVRLSILRPLIVAIVDLLQEAGSTGTLYRFDDWHEHDGFVTERRPTDWDALNSILADDASLYAAHHGDTYVRCAYFPEDYSFLLRFYVLDADEDPEHPGVWGDCDLCASAEVIERLRTSAPHAAAAKLVVTNAKEYFDGAYAG